MHTTFNGIPFRIFKLKSPQKHQLEKIAARVKLFEELYLNESKRIDGLPQINGTHNRIDIDATIKQTQKDLIRIRLEQDLMFEFCKNFKWEWGYYQMVLHELLDKSNVFRTTRSSTEGLPTQIVLMKEEVVAIREKYKKRFEALKNVVVKYGEFIFNGTIIL